ncbi:MAG: divalent-cation tolerance protein CutA [Acidobacteriota bacterium]
MIIKTTASLYPPLERAIRDLHPYEVPEILALPVLAGAPDYLDWLRGEVEAPPG